MVGRRDISAVWLMDSRRARLFVPITVSRFYGWFISIIVDKSRQCNVTLLSCLILEKYDKDSFDFVIDSFDKYFEPEQSLAIVRYRFYN